VRSWTKGDGAIDVGLQDMCLVLELLFRIHALIVIVCVKLLSSTSHFVFVFILEILEKTFFFCNDENQNHVMFAVSSKFAKTGTLALRDW
jgi:hypothetical protein